MDLETCCWDEIAGGMVPAGKTPLIAGAT